MPFNDPKNQPSLWFWLLMILLSVTGGLTRYVTDAQEKNNVVNWINAGISGFIGGFAGVVSTFYMLEQDFSMYMIAFGASLSGFLVVIALRVFTKFILKITENVK